MINMAYEPDIYILSDLHFDTPKKPEYQYTSAEVKANVKAVYNLLNQNKRDKIFILAGDFFNDLDTTLDFFDLLEQSQITSFVVLGNHDYWTYSSQKRTLEKSIEKAKQSTADNTYCRLLITGRKYTVGKLTFIGDSGFSNLHYLEYNEKTHTLIQTATTAQLAKITADSEHIKDFNAETVRRLNREWVEFARKAIANAGKNDSLIVVTHWLIDQEADSLSKAWWSSDAKLPRTIKYTKLRDFQRREKFWLVNGHTHTNAHLGNLIAVQAGYKNTKWFQELSLSQFGRLTPVDRAYGLIDTNHALADKVDYSLVKVNDADSLLVKKTQLVGYRRAGNFGNKKVMIAYLDDSENYLKIVKKEMRKILNRYSGHAGYVDLLAPQLYQAKIAVNQGVQVLAKGYQNNPFEFFTALVVTGYAYNHKTYLLGEMRKVTIYDVLRQAMVYQTLMEISELDVRNIESVRGLQGKKNTIKVGDLAVKIPVINGKHLTVEKFQPLVENINRQISEAVQQNLSQSSIKMIEKGHNPIP